MGKTDHNIRSHKLSPHRDEITRHVRNEMETTIKAIEVHNKGYQVLIRAWIRLPSTCQVVVSQCQSIFSLLSENNFANHTICFY
jgi:hypothetical protein